MHKEAVLYVYGSLVNYKEKSFLQADLQIQPGRSIHE